jgi:hypothetical protein
VVSGGAEEIGDVSYLAGQEISLSRGPFVEYEEDAEHDAGKAEEVIPAKFFTEVDESENAEDRQGDDLLYHFKLIAGEAFFVAQAVGGDLEAVFEKRDEPTDQDDFPEGGAFEFEVAVPGDGHESVGYREEDYWKD